MDHFNTLVTAHRNWNRHYQFVCFLGFFKGFLFFEFICTDMPKNTTEEYLVKAHWSECSAHIAAEKNLYFIQSMD